MKRHVRSNRSRRRRSPLKFLIFIFFCAVVVFAINGVYQNLTAENLQPAPSEVFSEIQVHAYSPAEAEEILLPKINVQLHSTNALLMNLNTGEVLHDQNSTTLMYPASLVKMMTAIVAIENISDLNEMVFLYGSIFQPIHSANATTAGFLPDDSVRAIDLLFGLLLPSGAECAVGLAIHTAGSENAFVAMMNEKAVELGMYDTVFTNTTGLHNGEQVSTVKDMAILLRFALGNETFYRIITSVRYSTAGTGLRPDGITFHSTLFSRISDSELSNGRILGGRTGFTNQAGQNLASFAEVDGEIYILVTSGAQTNGNHLTQALHIEDAFTMFSKIQR